MDVRLIKKEEREQSKKVGAVAFQFSSDCKVDENDEYPEPHCAAYGAFDDDGKLMGQMEVIQQKLYFDGHIVESADIAGVSTLPEYRHKKSIRSIFELVFEDMKAKKQYISQLYPFSYAYYNKFNYETTYERVDLRFPFAMLNEVKDIKRNNRCKLIDDNKNVVLREVYEKYASKHNGAYNRDDRLWNIKLGENIYKTQKYPYIYYNENNEPAGYFAYNHDENKFNVFELCYETLADLKGILGFILNFAGSYDGRDIKFSNLPADQDFSLMFTNQYKVNRSVSFLAMTAIADVKKIFELLKYPTGSGNFSISVDDNFQACNKGVYIIGYKDGKAENIEQKNFGSSDADINVSSLALAKLVFGTDNLCSYRYKFMDGIKINNNIETLEKVFVKKNIFIGDSF